jgi:hypothetical protein
MRKPSPVFQIRGIAIVIAVLAVLSGCESTDNWLKKWTDSDKEAIILGAPGANEYLHDIYELMTGDPATQAEIFANAQDAATLTPGTSTQLRYALVLATPGHAETSDIQAQSLLRSLLAQPELMTPAETALATIHLHEVEERLLLEAEANRLRQEKALAEAGSETTRCQRGGREPASAQIARRRGSQTRGPVCHRTLAARAIRQRRNPVNIRPSSANRRIRTEYRGKLSVPDNPVPIIYGKQEP